VKRRRKTQDSTPATLAEMGFRTELVKQVSRKQRAARNMGGLMFVIIVGALLAPIPAFLTITAANTAAATWNTIPNNIVVDAPLPQHSVILDKNGKKFATFYAENRVPVTASQIPENIRQAVIATEDANCYNHHGLDWRGTLRAVISTITGGATQGGSGITQQYVKNLLIATATSSEEADAATARTLNRKIVEAKTAFTIEDTMTKEEILTGYFNTVYFGDGAYGVGAAAKHYFDKTPAQLTVPEAALLAGVVNSPTSYNPVEYPKAAKERRNHVLNRMLAEKYVTVSEHSRYVKTPIKLVITHPKNGCHASRYPFYCQWVRNILITDQTFGKTKTQRETFLYRGGLTIRTALDPQIMKTTQDAATSALKPTGNPAAGIAVVEPGTGLVPAIATNRKFGKGAGHTEIVYPVIPSFQPGSTFKPFTAVAAIEAGVNPEYSINAPNSYTPPNRQSPHGGFTNAGDGEAGNYKMPAALRHSVNTWFVILENKIGVRRVAETANLMGITSLPLTGSNAITEQDASLTLGSYETSPLQLANAYATIAAHGIACTPTSITSITNTLKETIPIPQSNCKQVIRPSTANSVTRMMKSVIYHKRDPGTGKRAKIGRPAAGKTGTTDNASAVWFAGFTPQYATAVWIGDPRGGTKYPLNTLTAYNTTFQPVYGGGVPALLWRDTMIGIHKTLPKKRFAKPGGETFVGLPLYTVPDVRGLTPAQAATILNEAGFRSQLGEQPGPQTVGITSGRVTEMTPKQGTILTKPGNNPTIVLQIN